jgi:hypothetical protein
MLNKIAVALNLFIFLAFKPASGQEAFCRAGIKGKILPWFLGDMGGVNGLLGAEAGFWKRHSLGLDFYFHVMDNNADRDKPNEPPPSYRSFDKAVLLNYRCYFLSNFYIGAFGCKGYRTSSRDRGMSDDSTLSEKRNYTGIGTLPGYKFRFKNFPKLGLDINVGGFYNMKDVSIVVANGLERQNTFAHFNTYDMRVGLNLFWLITD